jgi:hypothetical protein
MSVAAWSADDVSGAAAMKIGDLVLYDGRPHHVRGFEPMSVPDRRVTLEDAETGEEVRVPIEELDGDPDEQAGTTEL